MPILQDAQRVTIQNSTFRDIAGHVYGFHGENKHDSIHQLKALSVMEAVYDFPSLGIPIDTGGCLKKMQDWMMEKNVPILLLSGPRGTGKSTFAQAIAHACVRVAHYPVISFCFNNDNLRRSDLNRAIPTLAAQLHELNAPGLKETIKRSLNDDPFMWSRSLGKQFTDLVIQPIHAAIDGRPDKNLNYVILLDGIDACKDYGALKQFLSDIKPIIADEVYYNRIKILCTSRDVPDVTAAFRSIINYCRRIPTQPSARENVLKFINNTPWRFSQHPQLDEINKYIVERSDGDFGLVTNILQNLSNTQISDILKVIDETAARGQAQSASDSALPQPRRRDTRSSLATSPLTNTSPLDILLRILRQRKANESMTGIANHGTINFMTDLLSMNDYVRIPSKISKSPEDTMNLLDFIIYLLDNNLLHAETLRDGNRRARRLMLKLGLEVKNIPQSVFIEQKEVSINNYDAPTGYGGFASVHEGSYRGNRVAIKNLRAQEVTKEFIREVLAWRTLSHDYVLPFIGVYFQDKRICLVSPFMENGTLIDWRQDKNPSAAEIEIRILQVAEGLQYLHYEGVIHCDLRGANVLLDSNLQVRIADFGLSRDSDATATSNTAMSKYFAAPELLSVDEDTIKRTEKSDIYAFGCLYYEIHFNLTPFGKYTSHQAMRLVRQGQRPDRLPDPLLSDEAWSLIEKCWDQDPGRRPSIDEVVEDMISWPQ